VFTLVVFMSSSLRDVFMGTGLEIFILASSMYHQFYSKGDGL
jgi:hypothetical protein